MDKHESTENYWGANMGSVQPTFYTMVYAPE